ncbi:MAG: hypothetical protein HYX73_10300 [Acidobacteria bacterium]|nr:hypothetical protein [Acidobacteriota bacterium]
MLGAQLRHAVIGDARELGQDLGIAERSDAGSGGGQELVVAGILIHEFESHLQVHQHGQGFDSPLVIIGSLLRDGLHALVISAREDLRKDIDFHFDLNVREMACCKVRSVGIQAF